MTRNLGTLAALLIASSLAACGGSVAGGGGGPTISTVTLSGGFNGTLPEITVEAVSQMASQSQTALHFSGGSSAGAFGLTVELTGYSLAAGTYTDSNTSLGLGSVTEGSTSYSLEAGSSAGTSAVGTYSVTITDPGTATTLGGVTTNFGVHGSMTATLFLNQTAGAATTTATMTF